ITSELTSARSRLGKPLLYLSVIGPASIPKGDIRDELVNFYQALLSNCESIHIVIEGTEFQQSIKRSVIANVLLVVPARGRAIVQLFTDMAGIERLAGALFHEQERRAKDPTLKAIFRTFVVDEVRHAQTAQMLADFYDVHRFRIYRMNRSLERFIPCFLNAI